MSLSNAHRLGVARHHHGLKNQASLSSSSLSLAVSSFPKPKLWFTTTTNTNDNDMDSTTPNRNPKNNRPVQQRTPQRKRKSKSLHPPSLVLSAPQTTRDRIRWLQDHNQVLTADNYYRKRHYERRLEDLGDTAEERLNWVRDKIFGFWRGGPSSLSNNNNSNTTSNNSTTITKNRPKRVGPKMDSKWWFWNIAFALLPAFCIAAYCEFIGKPQMLEYNRQVHVHRQKQKYGDAYVEQDDEELTKLTREAEKPLSVAKLYNAIVELFYYFFLGGQTPATITADTTPPGTLQNSNSNNQQQQHHQHQQQQTNIQNSQDRARNIDPKLTMQPSSTKPVNQQSNEDAQTIAELKRRLEELENRLNNAQHPSIIETTETPPSKSITHDDSSIGQGRAVSDQLQQPQQHSRIHDRALQRRALQEELQPKETQSSSATSRQENSNNQTSLATLVSSKIATFWKSLTGSSESHMDSAATTKSKTSDANDTQDTLTRSQQQQQQQKDHSSTTSNKVGDSDNGDTARPSFSMQKGIVSQQSKTTTQKEDHKQQSTTTIIKPEMTTKRTDDDDDDDDETRKQATANNSERNQTQAKTPWFRWRFWG